MSPKVTHGCYFKDGVRRADYVIVLEEGASLAPLGVYIRALEKKGLQFEKVKGLTVPKTFLLIYISQKALSYYARVYDIGLDEKKVHISEEVISSCFRMRSTPISTIPDKPQGEFTSCDRIAIIYKILENTKYGETENEYGLSKMLRLKIVEDAYPLHDGSKNIDSEDELESANDRQLLYYYWSNFGAWYKEIPLDMIQRYFGCEIAFYFAWLDYFNMMLILPTVFGIIVVAVNLLTMLDPHEVTEINEVCLEDNMHVCSTCEFFDSCVFKPLSVYCQFTAWTYVFDNYLAIAFAVVNSVWATLFIHLWRRKENELKLKWSVQFKDIGTEPRQRYMDNARGTKYNHLSGKMEPVVPRYETCARMALVVLICAFLIFLVVVACLAVIIYKIQITSVLVVSGIEYLHTHAYVLSMISGSLIQVVFIKIFGKMYAKLSIWLTDIENPRTQLDYDSSVLHKRYILSFTNSYIPLFYLAFMKGKLYTIPHEHGDTTIFTYYERDTCQPTSCVLGLCIQLAFLMLFKKFAGNILTVIKLKWKVWRSKRKPDKDKPGEKLPQYEEEYKLLPTNRYLLTTEFCEMVIDYGYVTFFVAAFPLAPLCAMLNNILECRSDAYKLVAAYRRPIPRKVPGIGAWDGVLLGATCLSTATNAIVIAFTSDFIGRELYRTKVNPEMKGYINSTLSVFAIKDYELFNTVTPNIDICYYRSIRYPPGHPKEYQLTGRYWREVAWRLIAVIIFEHVVFVCNCLLAYAIPSISHSVKQQLDIDRLLAREAKIHLLKDEMQRYTR